MKKSTATRKANARVRAINECLHDNTKKSIERIRLLKKDLYEFLKRNDMADPIPYYWLIDNDQKKQLRIRHVKKMDVMQMEIFDKIEILKENTLSPHEFIEAHKEAHGPIKDQREYESIMEQYAKYYAQSTHID